MQDRIVNKSFASPLALLFHYLETNQTIKFKESFDIFHNNNQLLHFAMDETIQSQTLLQKAVEHGNEEIFNYLIDLGYSENENKTDSTTKSNYIKILISKMVNFDEFYKWLQLLLKNNDKLVFDINVSLNHETILYKVFDHFPDKAQLIINCGATFDDLVGVMDNVFAALLKYKLKLTKDLASKFFVVAAKHRRVDVIEHLIEQGVHINYSDSLMHTALYYAVYAKDYDLVLYLLHHGAAPTRAIHLAVQQKNTDIVRTLLFYGGGLFQSFPAEFHNLGIELRGCYIEGMTVSGVAVNPRMKGYARAIYSVEELKTVIDNQNRLKPGMFIRQIPVHNLKSTLEYLESEQMMDNKAISRANEQLDVKRLIPSLKFLSWLTLDAHREQLVVDDGETEVTFTEAVKNLSENIRDMINLRDPAQNRALMILQGRLEELQLLEQHITHVSRYEHTKFKVVKTSAKWACGTSISLPISFGIYVGCTYCMACISSPTGVNFVSTKAMYFFGVPGIIIAAILAVNISIIAYFENKYPKESKDTNLCCSSWQIEKKYEPLANIDPKILLTIEALIAVTENENLPHEIKIQINELRKPDLLLSELSAILELLYNYYQTKVIPEIKNDISYTNYNHYSDFRIFRQIPARLQMEEEISFSPNELTRLLPQ